MALEGEMSDSVSAQVKKLDSAINYLIVAMKAQNIRPDRTWSAAINALIKKRDFLTAQPTNLTGNEE
jgi:hypothetical protein